MKLNAKMAIIFAMPIWAAATGLGETQTTYSQFLEQVRSGKVASVVIVGGKSASHAEYKVKDGETSRTVLPSDYREALAAMEERFVNIEIRDSASGWLPMVMNATPFLLLLGLWMIMMYRMKNGGLKMPRISASD